MRARASKDGLTLRIIAGSNNVLLAMDLEEPKQKGCLGFTMSERTRIRESAAGSPTCSASTSIPLMMPTSPGAPFR